GSAPGVTVHFGQDQAGRAHLVVERLRHADRFLAGHRVGDQQNLGWVDLIANVDQFLHQAIVDLEPAGGVDDDRVVAAFAGVLDRVGGDFDRVLAGPFLVNGDVDLLPERLQLVDRGRTVDVGGDQERVAPLLPQVDRELTGVGGLTGPLETDQHQNLRWVF